MLQKWHQPSQSCTCPPFPLLNLWPLSMLRIRNSGGLWSRSTSLLSWLQGSGKPALRRLHQQAVQEVQGLGRVHNQPCRA
jgi:hypothetical protein